MTTEEKFAKFFDEVWPARAAKLKPALRMTAVEEFIASGGCEVCPTVATDGPCVTTRCGARSGMSRRPVGKENKLTGPMSPRQMRLSRIASSSLAKSFATRRAGMQRRDRIVLITR